MPPGNGKRDLHISIDAELKAYLEKEAAYRKISLSTLVLDAVSLFLTPERQERAALSDELQDVTRALATLKPTLQGYEDMARNHTALTHDVQALQEDMRQSVAGLEAKLSKLILVGTLNGVALVCLLYVVGWRVFF